MFKGKFRKIIAIGVMVVMAFSFAGCVRAYRGTFYSIQQAYDQGLLTHEELRSIAYYWNGSDPDPSYIPMPKNPETLSAKTEKSIKKAVVKGEREEGYRMKMKDVHIDYFGIYNNCIALYIWGPVSGLADLTVEPSDVRIDGIIFQKMSIHSIAIIQ